MQRQRVTGAVASQLFQEPACFPTQMARAWNSAKQKASPRAGKVYQHGLSATQTQLFSGLLTLQFSPSSPTKPLVQTSTARASPAELFCSRSLCFHASVR